MNTTFIAGPCVIESAELLDTVAARLTEINRRLGVQIIFKASFDKANRTSIRSYRGVGMEKGLQMLADVRSKWGLRLLTDIHESWQAAPVGEVVDVIQIPAFLCRQTDLLVAAAKTGRTVNIKKAQFLSGEDMRYPYEKACDAGAADVWLTERGNSFGYNNLVVDFRNIPDMLRIAPTVVMDCTHSVQRPGAAGGKTGGNREFVPAMALAAKAFGANGYFFEVHPDPDHALSDGPNSNGAVQTKRNPDGSPRGDPYRSRRARKNGTVARRALRRGHRDDPPKPRQTHHHRHGQVGADRPQDGRHLRIDGHAELLPPSGRSVSRRSGHDLERGHRAGDLLLGRNGRGTQNRPLHPQQRQPADLDDGQSGLHARHPFGHPPRRLGRPRSLHPAPRSHDLDHGADRHGRRDGRRPDEDAQLFEQRLRTAPPGRSCAATTCPSSAPTARPRI